MFKLFSTKYMRSAPVVSAAWLTITAGIIMPSMYFWFANRDNEVYQRQPQWVKDNYWVVVHDGVPYRISKPFDLGVVFGTGTEQLLDWLNTEHPDELNDFLYDFIFNFTGFFIYTFIIFYNGIFS